MVGAIMETAVVAELARTLAATKAERPRPSVQSGYVVYAGD
jgi:hypothetical protein